jgi:hypothetical protein
MLQHIPTSRFDEFSEVRFHPEDRKNIGYAEA